MKISELLLELATSRIIDVLERCGYNKDDGRSSRITETFVHTNGMYCTYTTGDEVDVIRHYDGAETKNWQAANGRWADTVIAEIGSYLRQRNDMKTN